MELLSEVLCIVSWARQCQQALATVRLVPTFPVSEHPLPTGSPASCIVSQAGGWDHLLFRFGFQSDMEVLFICLWWLVSLIV